MKKMKSNLTLNIFENNYDENITIEEKKSLLQLDELLENKEITIKDLEDFISEDSTNEGILGGLLGGLAGFALGQSVGKIIARCLGVEQGLLYDVLTSRLLATALGYELGKR